MPASGSRESEVYIPRAKKCRGYVQGRVCRAASGMREAGDTRRRGVSDEESRMEERSVKAERGVRGR